MNVLNALAEATRAQDTANGDTPRPWGHARADHFVNIPTHAGEIGERYDEVVASGHSRNTCHARVTASPGYGNDHSPAATLTRDGYGPIDPDLARELAADGTWRR